MKLNIEFIFLVSAPVKPDEGGFMNKKLFAYKGHQVEIYEYQKMGEVHIDRLVKFEAYLHGEKKRLWSCPGGYGPHADLESIAHQIIDHWDEIKFSAEEQDKEINPN